MEIINGSVNGSVILLEKSSGRTFHVDMNQKISKHGFKKLDSKKIFTDKLTTNDYTYEIYSTNLIVYFDINNGHKSINYSVVCDEIFDHVNMTINISDISDLTILKNIISSLRQQVTNLKYKVEDLTETIKSKEETYEYDYDYDYEYEH